jgi:hypothetical protein
MNTLRPVGRLSVCVLASLLCAFSTGCNILWPKREAPDVKPPVTGTADTSTLTPASVVRCLNAQADLIESVDAPDISLTVKGPGGSPPSLTGSLMVQKPHNFRLVGKFMGSQEVLAGSNNERFWFYVPRMGDALMHCSYSDFDKGVELPFPFDPEWVLEAMGMSHIPTDGRTRIELDNKNGTFRLIEDSTLHGQKVTKVTVCYQLRTTKNVPQIKQRVVYDANGKVLCMATTKSVSRFPVGRDAKGQPVYAIVPEVIKLEWPAQETSMELDLGRVRINTQMPADAFQMPRAGSRQVDLGRDRPAGRVVPARGQ